jgi:DNA-binding IclR family transcriptional regulator
VTVAERIVRVLQECGGAKTCVIARETNAPYSTVRAALVAMLERDALARSPDLVWALKKLPIEEAIDRAS